MSTTTHEKWPFLPPYRVLGRLVQICSLETLHVQRHIVLFLAPPCGVPCATSPAPNACCEGYDEVVRMLLELGADWAILMSGNGWSPLFVASWAGSTAVVALLIEK